MQRIFALLVFASIGALLTMLLLPPVPRLRTYRIYPYSASSSNQPKVVDWGMVPIPGHPAPPHTPQHSANTENG